MLNELPRPVAAFFTSSNEAKPEVFQALFSEDAVVVDEGRRYEGLTAIIEWSDRNIFGTNVTWEIVKIARTDGEIKVTSKVDGTYDKTGLPDPLYLDLYFTTRGNSISGLRIAPLDHGHEK